MRNDISNIINELSNFSPILWRDWERNTAADGVMQVLYSELLESNKKIITHMVVSFILTYLITTIKIVRIRKNGSYFLYRSIRSFPVNASKKKKIFTKNTTF